MKNKKLEERLRKKNHKFWIKIIETLEKNPKEAELKLDKRDIMTGNAILDKMIVTYLEKIGVKVMFLENLEQEKQAIIQRSGNPVPTITICEGEIHNFLKRKTKRGKLNYFKKRGYQLFTIDKDTYVTCPECHNFEKR